jgi:hydrogenase maturation protease
VRIVVAGIGNAYRSDDGAGLAVAERIGATADGVDVIACEQEPLRLLDAWNRADVALVVDAVSSGAKPGTIHRFDASDDALPATVFRGSTHALGVGEAIELARALGRLPGRVLVFGIEGERFSAGARLSPAVADAVETVAAELREEARCTSVR